MKQYLCAHEEQAKGYLLATIEKTLLYGLDDEIAESEKNSLKKNLPELHKTINSLIFTLRDRPMVVNMPCPERFTPQWTIHPITPTFKYGDLYSRFAMLPLGELFRDFLNCARLIKLFQYPDDVLDEVFSSDCSAYEQALYQARVEVLEGKLTPQHPDEWPVHQRALQIARNQQQINPTQQADHKSRLKILAALLDETNMTKENIFSLIRPDDPYHADKSRTARDMVRAGKKLLRDDPTLRLQFQPEVNTLLHSKK